MRRILFWDLVAGVLFGLILQLIDPWPWDEALMRGVLFGAGIMAFHLIVMLGRRFTGRNVPPA